MKPGLAHILRVCALLLFPVAATCEPTPPFSRHELNDIVRILVDSGRLLPSARIARTAVVPAPKNGPALRRARVTLLDNTGTHETLVDLQQERVIRWDSDLPGRAPVLSAEWARASAALKADARWQRAMAKRGYTTFDDIFCEALSPGYFPQTAAADRRVLRMPCYDVSDAVTHIYGRPVEGLVATVDAQTGDVLAVLDEGVIPVPGPAPQPPVTGPLAPATPAADVILKDNKVIFGPWDLRVRLDDQFGLIVSGAGFSHNGERRSVLAEGHVSEIFVPYTDPTESWAFRTYLDAGEFGLGTLTSRLVNGYDCPENARYLNALTLSPLGRVIEKQNAICIFPRDMAGPLWRHYEALNGAYTGKQGRELVVRSIASIAHYDYVMDWVFRPQGEIEIRIGATGIDAVRAIPPTEEQDPFSRRVTPDLAAVFHDHFFSLRIDPDIDGRSNRLVREHVRRQHRTAQGVRRSSWTLEAETIRTEGPLAMTGPGVWRIEASDRLNAVGQPAAYQMIPDKTVSLLDGQDWPQQRAAFSARSLWVTRHASAERAAAGAYPNQSRGGHGIPDYANGESIVDADIVLWATLGFRHITRPEDWPVLSTVWKSVLLKPYGFFDANPTVKTGE